MQIRVIVAVVVAIQVSGDGYEPQEINFNVQGVEATLVNVTMRRPVTSVPATQNTQVALQQKLDTAATPSAATSASSTGREDGLEKVRLQQETTTAAFPATATTSDSTAASENDSDGFTLTTSLDSDRHDMITSPEGDIDQTDDIWLAVGAATRSQPADAIRPPISDDGEPIPQQRSAHRLPPFHRLDGSDAPVPDASASCNRALIQSRLLGHFMMICLIYLTL